MKKFWIFTLASLALFISILLVAQDTLLAPQVKKIIEEKASESLGTPVTIKKVNLQFFPPMEVALTELRFHLKSPVATLVAIPKIRAKISLWDLVSKNLFLRVGVAEPRIQVELPAHSMAPSVQTPAAPTITTGLKVELGPELAAFTLGTKVIIRGGEISVTQGERTISAGQLSLELDAPDIQSTSTLKMSGLAKIDSKILKMSIPVNVDSRFSLDLANMELLSEESVLDLGGLKLDVRGSANLATQSHNWSLNAKIPQIRDLKVPPRFLPPGTWSGTVESSIRVTKQGAFPWNAEGNLKLEKIQGKFNLDMDGKKAGGELSSQVNVDFKYNKELMINRLVVWSDMTKTFVEVPNLFVKPAGIPLVVSVDGYQRGGALTLRQGAFAFANLRASVLGTLDYRPRKMSSIKLEIKKTKLDGFEKFLPMLSGSPLKGELQLKAGVKGDLQDPLSLSVSLNPLMVKNFRGDVKWESEDKAIKVQGPVRVNTRSVIVAQGKALKSASVNAQVDLTPLSIDMGETFQKPARSPLRLNVNAGQKEQSINIKSSSVTTSAGAVKMSGKVSNPQKPKLNINIDTRKIRLAQVSNLIPMLKKWSLSGEVKGKVNVSGVYDFAKGYQESPLRAYGNLSATMPQFKWTSPPKAETPQGTNAPAPAEPNTKPVVEPLAPRWPIVKSSNIGLTFALNRLNYDDLVVSGIRFKGRMRNGTLSGNGSVKRVFGGTAKVQGLSASLTSISPKFTGKGSIGNLDIAKALTWGAPDWKEIASGQLSGVVNFNVPHPAEKNFVSLVRASGGGKLKNGFLNTLPFDQYINQKLEKIPGVGKKNAVKTGGAKGSIDAAFKMADGQINFSKLNISTPEKNDFRSKGWIKVPTKTMDLTGTAYLAQVPVKGSFKEANSDSSGRLVVPVRFSGSVMSPSLNPLDGTINKMLEKMARYEAQKLKRQAQQKFKAEAQKQIQKSSKRLEQEAAKALKKIF